MKIKRFFMITLAGLLLISGCASAIGKDAQLTEDDNGRSLNVALGQAFTVKLEGNPTTGYTWQVEQLEEGVLSQEGDPAYVRASDRMGSPGVFTFTFKAVGQGKSPLKLVYVRPWEKNKPPARTFSVNITVK